MSHDKFLVLFAKDKKGRNFREYVQTLDYGYGEFWSIMFFWEDKQISFHTQYNPPRFCREENCMHFPRNHLDDCIIDFDGNIIETGTCPI
jgi:hypothetical protein